MPTRRRHNPGYTVFGRVKEGIQVVDAISRLPTGASAPLKADVPTPFVAIKSIARLDKDTLAALPGDGAKRHQGADRRSGDGAELRSGEALDRALPRGVRHPDPAIAVTEAQAALALKDERHAVFVLEEYFVTTQPDDPSYEDAVALYEAPCPRIDRAQHRARTTAFRPPSPRSPTAPRRRRSK